MDGAHASPVARRLIEAIDRATTARATAVAPLAELRDEALALPWHWQGTQVDVRFGLRLLAQHDLDALATVERELVRAGLQPTGAQRRLREARAALGALLATLVGVPDALLDRRPAPDPARRGPAPRAPTLRQLLQQRIERERASVEAIARAVEAPLPQPVASPAKRTGGNELDRYRAGLLARRRATVLALGALTDRQLERPAALGGAGVPIHFLLDALVVDDGWWAVRLARTIALCGGALREAPDWLGIAEQTHARLIGALTPLVTDPATKATLAALPAVVELIERHGQASEELAAALAEATAPPGG